MPTIDPNVAYGLTASAATVLLLQVLKSVGLPDKFWPWATLAIAAVFVVGGALINVFPVAQQVLNAIIAIGSVYLIATGLYHTGKNVATHTGLSSPATIDHGAGDGPNS